MLYGSEELLLPPAIIGLRLTASVQAQYMPWMRRTSAWQQEAELTLATCCKVCRCFCRRRHRLRHHLGHALPGERVLLSVLRSRRLLTPQLEAQLQQVAAPTGHNELIYGIGFLRSCKLGSP